VKKATISIADFETRMDDWLAVRKDFNHQPSGLAANRRDLLLFLKYARGHGVLRIAGETLLDFTRWLIHERHNGPGAANRKISTLRSYFRHLRFRQVSGAERFPIESLPRARQPYEAPMESLEVQEVPRILAGINKGTVLGYRNFTLYRLQYRLGLRLGEVLAIDRKDIDIHKQTLRIHGKGRRDRLLPLAEDLVAILERWAALRPQLRGAGHSDALFLSKKGHRLSARIAQETFQALVAKAGPLSLKKVTPHSLRHAFASHALETDTSDNKLIVLKHFMGHAIMKSTQRYAHPSMRILRQAVNDHPASEILAELIEENVLPLPIQSGGKITA
jgi:integrase/recombinase XerC